MGPRLKSFARGCIYAVIAFMAFQIVAGAGVQSQAGRQVTLTSQVMRHPGGRIVVGLVGVIVVVVGATLVHEGVTRKFEKYLDLSDASAATRRAGRGHRRRRHDGPRSSVRSCRDLCDPGRMGLRTEKGCGAGRGATFVA